METAHRVTLLLIGLLWLLAYRLGRRWCRACGVTSETDAAALATVLPTAALLVSVHLLATLSLLTGKGLVTPESTAVLFAAVVALAHRLFNPKSEIRNPQCWRLGHTWPAVAVVAGAYALFALEALTRYPTGADALSYHLPLAVTWMRERAINLAPGLLESCPENGMIVPCLMVFAGLERLLSLAHLPTAVVCGLSVYALARAAGAAHRAATLAACVALSVPIVLFQSVTCYIDLYAATAWLLALLALTWVPRTQTAEQRRGLAVLAGLSAGVALGGKSTYLILVPLLGMVALLASRPRPLRNVAMFTVASLVCSGFWFVRGTVQAGNPLYPVEVRIGQTRLLPGVSLSGYFPERTLSRKLDHWLDYPWRERKYGTGYVYGVDNGLGAAYATLVPLGLAGAAVSVFRKRPRSTEESWQLAFLVLAMVGAVLLLTLFHETIRYVLPLLLVTVPLAAARLNRTVEAFPRWACSLVAAALVVTAAVATYKPVHAFLGRAKDQVWSRADYYQIPPLVDEFPAGTRILNLSGESERYPLLGRRLNNLVVNRSHWKVLTGAETVSNRALHEHAIDYLFVRGSRPDDWPDDLAVQQVFDGSVQQPSWVWPKAALFRVLGSPTADRLPIRDRTARQNTAG